MRSIRLAILRLVVRALAPLERMHGAAVRNVDAIESDRRSRSAYPTGAIVRLTCGATCGRRPDSNGVDEHAGAWKVEAYLPDSDDYRLARLRLTNGRPVSPSCESGMVPCPTCKHAVVSGTVRILGETFDMRRVLRVIPSWETVAMAYADLDKHCIYLSGDGWCSVLMAVQTTASHVVVDFVP